MRTFTEALMEMKRKATLSSRPVSKQEVSGIASGQASIASERLARIKQLDLQERGLAEEKRRTDLQVKVAKEAHEAERKEARYTTVGAGIGFLVGGPYGAAVGATAGSLVSGCIIISACTHPNSDEVHIAREFRDKYLGSVTLFGYYRLSIFIVPLIKRSKTFKRFIKKALVDNLIEYGNWILGYNKKKPSQITILITEGFLGLCKFIGNRLFLKAEEA